MTPLDTLEAAFTTLVTGPQPLALDGKAVHGLPARRIPLDELRAMLLHPSTSYATRDAAWTVLVDRAQACGPEWVVGAAGMLLPGLRRTANSLARAYSGEVADLDAEVLAGLVDALDGFDPTPGRIAARLLWAAYRRGDRFRRREQAEAWRRARTVEPHAPSKPWGHPDLLLAEAITAKVITTSDAELIASTRIERVFLPDLATAQGVQPDTLRHRRRRAERRLVAWLDTR